MECHPSGNRSYEFYLDPSGNVYARAYGNNGTKIYKYLANGTLAWPPTGVRWADGTTLDADVIFWNTGFRHSLDHLASLNLMNNKNGIEMSGKLATQVAKDPRIHLTGYGPSASTIGANRAGRAAAQELIEFLVLKDKKGK